MSFSLKNQLKVALTVSGTEIPINPELFSSISIVQNTKQLLPTLQMGLYDSLGLSQSTGLFLDAGKLSLEIGPNTGISPSRTYDFRIFSMPNMTPTHKGHFLDLTAYLDKPQFLSKMVDKPYEGTSSAAIARVASEVGLIPDVAATFDKMPFGWLPNNKSLGKFARFICNHGWAGAKSCMMSAVTDLAGQWALRYKDVTEAIKGSAVASFNNTGVTSGKNFFALNHSVKSFSGMTNTMFSYGSQIVQPKLIGDLDQFAKVAVQMATGALEMNSAVKKLVGNIRNEYFPMDVGNTHANFAKASHQNRVLRSTYSNTIHVMVADQTNLSVFDPVDLNFMNNQTGDSNVVYNGRYLVESKTQFIKGEEYRELLVLTNQGVNSDSSGERVG